MIKIEKADVFGWESAIRGMRNPMNSWDKSDTYDYDDTYPTIGPNDLSLMKKLVNAGTDHSKFMRFVIVTCDVTAPLYWWKEFDTYKVGTVANSCSTMHKIHDKEFTLDDFSHEYLGYDEIQVLNSVVNILNINRDRYNECTVSKYSTSDACAKVKKYYWNQLIQLLPSSYNQRRTVFFSYAVLQNMYRARKNHKLVEWHRFCDFIRTLPYSELITGEATDNPCTT